MAVAEMHVEGRQAVAEEVKGILKRVVNREVKVATALESGEGTSETVVASFSLKFKMDDLIREHMEAEIQELVAVFESQGFDVHYLTSGGNGYTTVSVTVKKAL